MKAVIKALEQAQATLNVELDALQKQSDEIDTRRQAAEDSLDSVEMALSALED